MITLRELIANIEARVRPTIATTHRFVDGEHTQTYEGRISAVDFEALLSLAKKAVGAAENDGTQRRL